MTKFRSLARRLCMTLMLTSLAVPASAQSQASTAEINGRVVDAQGGVLPGVTVTAKNEATGYVRTAVTNNEGLFGLPLLPPGNYEVSMELPGFASASRRAQLTVGASVNLNQTLQVTGVSETVQVTAGAPLVETTTSIRTTTVGEEAIDNLPINGRRFQDFVTLTPTVQVDTSRGQLSFAGQRGINANVNIDGADYNQPFFGGLRGGERSNNAFTVPQEAVQEFQVVAAGYSAEFGRSTAGLVNVITKSGTNNMSGSGFYVNRHRKLADKNAFGQTAAPTQQQFGGAFGGPIQRDRLFFFGAYEQQVFRNERAVAFNLTGIAPTADNSEAYDYYRSLETDFAATNDAIATLGKVDYQWPAGSRVSLRYSFSTNKALNSNATGNALEATTTSALSNNGTEKNGTNTFVGQFTTAIRSNLLFEARGQYSREKRPREANEESPTVQNSVGNYGTVNFLPTTQKDWRGQGAANLTAVAGTHTVKAGVEYNHVYADQKFGFNQFGRWTINGSAASALEVLTLGGPTANRFDVPLTGAATTATYLKQLGNLALDFATDEMGVFVQDSWRATPRLTINAGVRYEAGFNPTPEANNDFMVNALRGVTFPVGRTADPTQIPDQTNQFAPRVGFAWDVTGDGRTVLRGHSGLYFARTPGLLLGLADEQLPRPGWRLVHSAAVLRAGDEPEQHPVQAAAAHRHRPEPLRAEQPANPDHRTDDADRYGARSLGQSVRGRAAARDGPGLQEPARHAGGSRGGTRAGQGPDARGRVALREDGFPAAQSRAEPGRAGGERRRRAAPDLRESSPGDRAWIRPGARVDGTVRVSRHDPHEQAPQVVGPGERQLRAQQVGIRRRQRARFRWPGSSQHIRPRSGMGPGAPRPAASVQRLRRGLPAVQLRCLERLPLPVGPAD